jgi:HPt (histidine-containing phosphotransfer) domain-containing protein
MQVPVELKRKYLERRIQEIDHLIQSLDMNDFAPALKLGHQVKGNAVTFEFPQIAPFGAEIEIAAQNRDKAILRQLAHSMACEIKIARLNFH